MFYLKLSVIFHLLWIISIRSIINYKKTTINEVSFKESTNEKRNLFPNESNKTKVECKIFMANK